jgi:hypothetical protein
VNDSKTIFRINNFKLQVNIESVENKKGNDMSAISKIPTKAIF